ncbi:hypothetical protein [sulfur-oxidizing endosymbiont of Gigantopelta aegis]|uniref:hypothetical protein n=1 Tax=sulfur-oxidizing endosymbiont of Gigantopelta aegis TaxID=2794934 RepID=UPI0018DDEA68|nr:hypothetical protein [sulfur-oxidizing endosymbiont of Gigantopelta aegis]
MSDDYLAEQNYRLAGQQWNEEMRRRNESSSAGEGSSGFGMAIICGLFGGVFAHYHLVEWLDTAIGWQYAILVLGDIAGFVLGVILIPVAIFVGVVALVLYGIFHLLKYILFTMIL